MFCPRCGSATEILDNVPRCIATGSDFSAKAWQDLEAIAGSEPGQAADLKIRYGSTWHCPADGAEIRESDGHAACTSCGRSLPGGLLYQLIEFHDHPQ